MTQHDTTRSPQPVETHLGGALEIWVGDCLESLRVMTESSADMCATSPPYFGLRDYGSEGEVGSEETVASYVRALVAVFEEVRRVLKPEGTLWLNLGDSYNGSGGDWKEPSAHALQHSKSGRYAGSFKPAKGRNLPGLKKKDLIGIPWTVALALREAGWYLRGEIIWAKPNPMPSPVLDRPTVAHESIFLLSKSLTYYYDAEAIAERCATPTNGDRPEGRLSPGLRNRRSVWSVPTASFSEAHFAVWPAALVEPMVLAGCPVGGVVLDPFAGSGTTGAVALKHRRRAVLCELNPEYAALIPDRVASITGMRDGQQSLSDWGGV